MPDHRHPSHTRHPLGDIIMIVFLAVLGNAMLDMVKQETERVDIRFLVIRLLTN